MGECSKCGDKAMTFTCKYCGKEYCSDHRLPENHECENLEEEIEKEKEEARKWFEEKNIKQETIKGRPRTQEEREYHKPSIKNDIIRTLKSNITLTIIGITVFSFLLQVIIPGYNQLLILEPELKQVLMRPWSILTVMLLHGGFFHIFANMVTFYFFGTALERVIGSRDLVKLYLVSGIAASIGFIIFRNLIYQLHKSQFLFHSANPSFSPLGPAVGASGAVVAVVAAVAVLFPDSEALLFFILPMKIKHAVGLFAGLELLNLVAKTVGITLPILGVSASSAHLTGLLIGYWYGKKVKEQYSTNRGFLQQFM